MSRAYTYNPEDGEFVDFDTLDDWKHRDEAKDARIAAIEAQLAEAKARLTVNTDHVAFAMQALLDSPKGVVPAMAKPFYCAKTGSFPFDKVFAAIMEGEA